MTLKELTPGEWYRINDMDDLEYIFRFDNIYGPVLDSTRIKCLCYLTEKTGKYTLHYLNIRRETFTPLTLEERARLL